MTPVSPSCNGTNITSTTTVFTGAGRMLGIFVSSVSGSPTIKISDGSTTKVNTFIPVAATWYYLPLGFGTSLVVTIAATIDCCVFWTNS